jgi:tRNA(fMet)-specific endonuclease VapC
MFQAILADFTIANLLPFDSEAAQIFSDLRKSGVRIGTMDLRIGAIARSRGFTVLTRNIVDFERIPGLSIDDWTKPAN